MIGLGDAAFFGLTESAIRHGIRAHGWQRLTRGVVLTARGTPTRDDWIQAGLTIAGENGAVSGWDAARIRGVGEAQPPTAQVLILTRTANQRSAPCLLVRRTSRSYSSSLLPARHPTLPSVSVVNTARAIADTALLCRSLQPVRAMVTSSIQRGLCRPEQLVAEFESGPRAHSYWLRRALEDLGTNAHSIAEAEAADVLRRARVPAFELNVDLVDATGRVVARADILWRHLRAVGEIESRAFHFDERSWNASMARHNRLLRHGLAVAHWPPSAIRNDPARWAPDVAAWLRSRAREVGVPYVPGRGALPCPADGHQPFLLT